MSRRAHSRGGRTCIALACALVLGAPAVASAQPGGSVVNRPPDEPQKPPPAPPVLKPPVLKKDEGAVYPRQAIDDKVKGSVEVTLIVEVEKDGTVENAAVETPQGHGFDEAAIEAAKKVVFEPATKDGAPIRAKVKHKYVFEPPPSRVVGRVTKQLGDAPIAGATVKLDGDGKTFEARTDADGNYVLEGVPAGKYTLNVAAEGYGPQTFEQTMESGEEARVELRLEKEAPPPPPPKPGEAIEEVQVRGTRPPREVTKRTLEQREINRIPGTNGDALRSIQNLPGVARSPGLVGLLIVRGAAPQETAVYVDGTLVPLVYHFGGLSSVIPTEMLDKIDFYPGNFSTYYGRVTGGIVDVGVKNPQVKKDGNPHAVFQADLIDARGIVEVPLGDTGWDATIAGRRSYVDVWLKPALTAAGAAVTTAPVYYDYQAVLHKSWDNGKHDFRLMFFGADDRLELLINAVNAANPGVGGDITFGTAFYRLQARYVGKLSDATEVRAIVAAGKDAVDFSLGDNFFNLTSYPIQPRFEISQKLAPGARNNLGLDVLYSPYTVNVRLPPPPTPGQPPPGPFGSRPPLTVTDTDAIYQPGMYDELELTPFRGTRIVPGVRVDYAKDTRAWDVQPRLSARQDLTKEFPRTTVKGGIGRFAQPPQPQETNPIFGTTGLRSNIANHYGAGVEQEFTRQIEASLEGFYRQYDGLVVGKNGNVGEGRAFGAETLLRYKPDDKFFGFVAYTLERSVRRDGPGLPEHLFQFDQTHILTAVGSYRLGNGWEVGARYRLVSGNLRTPSTYGFYDLTVGSYIPLQAYPTFADRLPLFHQLDLRVDKTWKMPGGSTFSAYLDIYNAYNQGNVEGVSYNYNYTLSTTATGIPFLPSIGIRAEL